MMYVRMYVCIFVRDRPYLHITNATICHYCVICCILQMFDDIAGKNIVISRIYLYSFISLFIYAVLNIFIAIVEEAFHASRALSTSIEKAFDGKTSSSGPDGGGVRIVGTGSNHGHPISNIHNISMLDVLMESPPLEEDEAEAAGADAPLADGDADTVPSGAALPDSPHDPATIASDSNDEDTKAGPSSAVTPAPDWVVVPRGSKIATTSPSEVVAASLRALQAAWHHDVGHYTATLVGRLQSQEVGVPLA